MTEAEARAVIGARHGAAAVARVAAFLDLVIEENGRQNLIAPSTIATIWQRHALDSAQLLAFDRSGETWLDVGTGGGFPGVVAAMLRDGPVVLCEPRARRAAFLAHCVESFNLPATTVESGKVERWIGSAGVISARAVASIDALFASTQHCAGAETRWILPKGRTAEADLAIARRRWRGVFHVEQSVVEPEAGIVIAEGVSRR